MTIKKLAMVLCVVFMLAGTLSAQFNLLHAFFASPTNGYQPEGSVILSGSMLYGTTSHGGADWGAGLGYGVVFKIGTNGTGFTLLHVFTTSLSDGQVPTGSLLLVGSTLYGMTHGGGANGYGTIFKVDTTGQNFALLHSFTGSPADGRSPFGTPILVGSTLYGMSIYGGSNNQGTIFALSIDPDNPGYSVLHSFTRATTSPYDGAQPTGSLVYSDALYGTTSCGGLYDRGTVFEIGLDGAGFSVIHCFMGGANDGATPYGSLTVDGTTLYGMTYGGGILYAPPDVRMGTIFSLDTSGGHFTILHAFANGTDDGAWPIGDLTLSGSMLYGMTPYGGSAGGTAGYGTIFQIDKSGTGFVLLHKFLGGSSDGRMPQYGPLAIDGPTLYGMTVYGGSASGGALGDGVIFAFTPGADISVSKTVDNLTPQPGTLVTYTITVGNSGPRDATGVTINDKLPAEVIYDSAVNSQGSYVPNTGDWTVGSLAVGANATLTLAGYVNSSGQIINTATKTAENEDDPDTSNDSASATITGTQFSLTTSANPPAGGTVTPGGTNSYDYMQNVPIQATANPGYVFTGWSGDLSGTDNPKTIPMNASKTIVGNFVAGRTLLAPVLLEPSTNASGQPTSVTLKWRDTNSSPQETKYKVRIKKAGGAYSNYLLAADSVQYIKSGLTLSKVYYWNVQAVGNGTTTKTSAWANGGVDFKFTVQAPVTLNAPVLVSPANNAVAQPISVQLQWTDTNTSPQEVSYKVRFKVAGGAYTNVTLPAGATSLSKSGLAHGKTYYWGVEAIGNGTSTKNSVWPADFKFTTS